MTRALLTGSLRVLTVSALLAVSSVPSLWAEPIAVTSGWYVIPDDEPGGFLFLGADGFVLRVGHPLDTSSPRWTCFRCPPGTAVDLSAVVGGPPRGPFSPFTLGFVVGANINGRQFLTGSQTGWLAGTLRFDAPTFVLPPSMGGLFLTAPFVLTGQVTGFAHEDLDARDPLFQVALVGQGTAKLSLSFFDGFFEEPEITYTFAATPEPASLMLFGTGFVGLVARTRTRRRRT